jgi:ATP-binding cassette subfamily C (CFTR/MRP) protein 1
MAFLFAQIIIVAVVSKYLAAVFPALLGLIYVVQHFYLRTSRQLRLLDIELMAPVNSLLLESLNGRVTIRAFQWDEVYMQRAFDQIDHSQRARYLLSSVQCWLSFHVDMIVTLLAIAFIVITTTLRDQIGPSNMGVGLTSVLGLGASTKTVLSFWVMLEVCLGGIMRVHDFSRKMKREEGPDEKFHDAEFPNWPSEGAVELRGVTASYEYVANERYTLLSHGHAMTFMVLPNR